MALVLTLVLLSSAGPRSGSLSAMSVEGMARVGYRGAVEIRVVWREQQVRDTPASLPRIVLERGSGWTDYHPLDPERREYSGLFDVFVDMPDSRRSIGSVKLLQRNHPRLNLPAKLNVLPNDCCSLGQTIDYYEEVESLGQAACASVLRALRDVTTDEAIAREFEHDPGFSASLIRFSEAKRIYHFRPIRLHREAPPSKNMRLMFEASLPGFSENIEHRHRLDIQFDERAGAVGRMAALVGENGTGKTQFFARLAAALWGLHRPESESLVIEGAPVGRVIAMSYSSLDAFERPPHALAGGDHVEARQVMRNYWYCGYRDNKGRIRPELLFSGLRSDLNAILQRRRFAQWTQMVVATNVSRHEEALTQAIEARDVNAIDAATQRLGAGQKTALTILTRLLAALRNGALVLFDEPELNLHPTLLSAVLRVIHQWLEEFDGYGIIATHSPIALQEIPGKNVRVLRRDGNVPFVQDYPDESFGQSISEITNNVFGLDEHGANYATVFRMLLRQGMTPEEVEQSFDRPLSLGARMALRALASET